MSEALSRITEVRRYRVLDVIGRGGFGTVYRARLEGADGFYKDVAIKLLRAEEAPPEVLQRFRDEARILGLVRDRAIITVDPPTRLAGRWAVVMEYVDGTSAARLVRAGPLPAGAVMEIAEEIARALHKIYRHPGRDGQPLCLVHRDIKPANIQISPAGEVKLLDFGIARADFSERESDTTMSIGGTRGYIAPERLHGMEGAEGDVFSLGVVIHKLATGELPDENDLGWSPGDPEPDPEGDSLTALLAFSSRMRSLRPQDRPTAREVQATMATLRARCPDEALATWAERVVPELSRLAEDELVGSVLSETLKEVRADGPVTDERPFGPSTGEAPRAAGWSPTGVLALIGLGLIAVAAVLALALGGARSPSTSQDDAARTTPDAPAPVEPAPQAPAPDEAGGPPSVAPEPAAPAPVLPAPVLPAPVVPPIAAPEPELPPAEPEPTGAPVPVRITSIPFGARIEVDGVDRGLTPQIELSLAPGTHHVVLTHGDARIEQDIEVGPRLASRFVWRVEEAQWDAGF